MNFVEKLVCICCGREYKTNEVDYYCPDCGYQNGILDVKYNYEAIKKVFNPTTLSKHADRSMWRYLPLLPVEDTARIPHLQVGWTPLYRTPCLAAELGVAQCYVKDEGRNPTASFKDRASVIGVLKAREKNASRITCASTGNAASSLAGFAAAAGIGATIFVPDRAPQAKLAQLLIYGAQVFAVAGTYDQTWELCMEASAAFGWYNRNCAINPYLIEGKKTVSLELTEQFLTEQQSPLPDWVVVSVGDGCTVGGVWKGFWEMQRLGFIARIPRILGVQAEGCRPFLTAWKENKPLVPVEANTFADSIAVGHPRNFHKGLQAIQKSQGSFIAVSDEEIARAMTTLARRAGVFGEPAGAAGTAGVKKAVQQGIIKKSESVAIIVTGNGLKDVQSAITAAGAPYRIAPEIAAVKAMIKQVKSP
jgi:threonine synthase